LYTHRPSSLSKIATALVSVAALSGPSALAGVEAPEAALDEILDLLDLATTLHLAANHGNQAVAEDFDR
jgi:hypothetical protein